MFCFSPLEQNLAAHIFNQKTCECVPHCYLAIFKKGCSHTPPVGLGVRAYNDTDESDSHILRSKVSSQDCVTQTQSFIKLCILKGVTASWDMFNSMLYNSITLIMLYYVLLSGSTV